MGRSQEPKAVAWTHPGAVGLGTAAIVAVRVWPDIIRPAFLNEETVGFWAATFASHPIETLVAPWNGFLHVIERLAFLGSRVFPADVAPLVTLAAGMAGIGLVAAFVASARAESLLPDRRLRILAALGLALLPFDWARLYTTILNLHWFLGLYLAALVVIPARRWDPLAVLVIGLSSPVVVFLVPWVVILRRGGVAVAASVAAGAQVAMFLTAPRVPASFSDPVAHAAAVLTRLALTPLGDGWDLRPSPILVVAVTALVVAAVVVARDRLPRTTLLLFGYLAVVTPAVGLLSIAPEFRADPEHGARFFMPAAWLLLTLTVAGLLSRRQPALVLAVLFVAGLGPTFVIEPTYGDPWGCIGGPACEVGLVDLSGSFRQPPVGVMESGVWLYR